jgi:circadian clock protein KaiC
LKRTATGVAGLDLVLNGGLEPGAVVVVAGAPGTGKTILAQQMCFATGTAEHTFRIGSDGIEVFPRIETLIPHLVSAVASQVPSGIPGLDALMGGGAKQGDATLVTGPSGVGKTTFGLRWLTQGLEQGERCLYVTFQDTADQLVREAAAYGWDLTAALASGNLSISYVPMGDLDLDVLATAVRSEPQ